MSHTQAYFGRYEIIAEKEPQAIIDGLLAPQSSAGPGLEARLSTLAARQMDACAFSEIELPSFPITPTGNFTD